MAGGRGSSASPEDPVGCLPEELVARVLAAVAATGSGGAAEAGKALARAACVSRAWRAIAEDDALWQPLCALDWPALQQLLPNTSSRLLYSRACRSTLSTHHPSKLEPSNLPPLRGYSFAVSYSCCSRPLFRATVDGDRWSRFQENMPFGLSVPVEVKPIVCERHWRGGGGREWAEPRLTWHVVRKATGKVACLMDARAVFPRLLGMLGPQLRGEYRPLTCSQDLPSLHQTLRIQAEAFFDVRDYESWPTVCSALHLQVTAKEEAVSWGLMAALLEELPLAWC